MSRRPGCILKTFPIASGFGNKNLLGVLHRLVDQGNTMIVI